jgi:hypothetical protein
MWVYQPIFRINTVTCPLSQTQTDNNLNVFDDSVFSETNLKIFGRCQFL